jgi:hypothetical protein
LKGKKYFKTTFKVEVLSEGGPASSMTLEEVLYEITHGEFSGDFEVVSVKELTARQAARELINQGSDPAFFNLDENGNDLDDSHDE